MEYETLRADRLMEPDDEIAVSRTDTTIRCPLHAHDFIELVYIESGRGYHMIGETKARIKKGDYFILSPNVPHEYAPDKDQSLVLINCIFHPRAIDISLEGCKDFVDVAYHYLFHSFYSEKDPKNYIQFVGIHSKEIGRLLAYMAEEYAAKKKGYKQILKSELVRLLILSFRLYTEDEKQQQDPPVLKQLVAESTMRYIQQAFGKSITTEGLAERCYLSPSYFNKLFKEAGGMTALQYLQKVRVEEACRLLRQTALPTSQIAIDVGYSNIKFFYELFKKATGRTPGEYRKEQSKSVNSKEEQKG